MHVVVFQIMMPYLKHNCKISRLVHGIIKKSRKAQRNVEVWIILPSNPLHGMIAS